MPSEINPLSNEMNYCINTYTNLDDPNKASAPLNKNPVPEEKSDERIKYYDELSDLIFEDQHFHSTEESQARTFEVIAFLIQATKELNPNTWKGDINDIENKIKQIRQEVPDSESSYRVTTWFLTDLFLHLYQTAVIKDSLNTDDPIKVRFYNRIFKNINNLKKLETRGEKNKEAVPIGGIHESFIPDWYREHTMKHKKIRSI